MSPIGAGRESSRGTDRRARLSREDLLGLRDDSPDRGLVDESLTIGHDLVQELRIGVEGLNAAMDSNQKTEMPSIGAVPATTTVDAAWCCS